MPQFQVEERVLKHFDAQNFPHGYIVICSTNPLDDNPAYWGTISLHSKGVSVKFQYTIDGMDKNKKRYDISIFGDKEFLSCLLTVTIYYVDDTLEALDYHVTECNVKFIPDEIYKLLHLIVYNSTFSLPTIYAQQPNTDPRAYMENGFCIYFQEKFKEGFEGRTEVSLETIISTINLLLG